jgi:hypothetical protein
VQFRAAAELGWQRYEHAVNVLHLIAETAIYELIKVADEYAEAHPDAIPGIQPAGALRRVLQCDPIASRPLRGMADKALCALDDRVVDRARRPSESFSGLVG